MIERYAITVYFRTDKTQVFRNLHLTRTIRIIVAASWIVVGCMWHLSSAPVGSANPVNPAVVAGEATVSGVGTDLVTIQQASQHAVIHWSQFNIAPGEVTSFLQPVGGIALNRIFDASPSLINGALNATGTVFLLNPNGVLFGGNAQVNVGGLVASTLHMTDADFLSGIYRFGGAATHLGLGETAPNAMVRNEGEITAGPFGAYLFAHNVENAGIIRSPSGHIALAAGASAYLSNRPDGRGLFVEVTAPAGQAANLKDLIADGGQVSLFGKVVNQSGLIQANSVQQRNGRVELIATDAVTLADGSRILAKGDATGVSDGGSVIVKAGLVSGDANFLKGAWIDVSGSVNGGNGGFIELSGSRIKLDGDFRAWGNTGYRGGRLLIDPPELSTMNPITNELMNSLGAKVRTSGVEEVEFMSAPGEDLRFKAFYDLGPEIDFNTFEAIPDTGWLIPSGRTGTITFTTGRNLVFENASLTNDLNGFGIGSRWDYILKAPQGNVELLGSTVSTGFGGKITVDALLDVRMAPSGGLWSMLETVSGGDISITAGRDVISPSIPIGQIFRSTGIRLSGPGNLTMTMGGNWLGAELSNTKPGPGFLLTNGTARIDVGGQVGTANSPAAITLGGAQRNQSGQLETFEAHVEIAAQQDVHLSVVQDRGLLEGFEGSIRVTADPRSSISVLSRQGDIVLDPSVARLAAIGRQLNIYPASADFQAPNGNIIVNADLGFWPSVTGRINFLARHEIRGTRVEGQSLKDPDYRIIFVGDSAQTGRWELVYLPTAINDLRVARFIFKAPPPGADVMPSPDSFPEWPTVRTFSAPPTVGLVQGSLDNLNVDPNHPFQDVTMKTLEGSIHTLSLNLLSPVFKKAVTIDTPKDIHTFRMSASVFDGAPALVRAGGNLDMTQAFCGSGCVPGGLEFYGNGIAQIRVGSLDSNGNLVAGTGTLNLGDSTGIIHRLALGSTVSNAGGRLDIAVGKDIVMTQSRIITQNGASVWIHGLGTKPAVNTDGTATGQVIVGVTTPGTNVLTVDGKVVKVNGVPVVLDGTQPIISQGTIVLDRPGATINGKSFSPMVANGKPIFVGGRIVLLVDGQIQLADASLVMIEQATGGKLDVGALASSETSGILTVRGGAIDIKTTGDVNVNQSRVATLGGGNISITSEAGDINAGTGGRNESIRFAIEQTDAQGNVIAPLVIFVPGSGIFTFHPSDPKFPLNFPKFDTPQITALKGEIIKQNFLGRDTTSLENQVSKLVAAREPEYRQIFEQFIMQNPGKPEIINGVPTGRFLPLELGDINLRAGQDLVVPSAGIRGRRIRISAGRNLDLQGGTVEGEVQFDVAGSVKGNLSSFVGSFSGTSAIGGSVSGGASAGGSSLGGGLSGVTGTVAATASSTSSSSGTASKTVEAVQEKAAETSTQQAKAAAQNQTASRDGQQKTVQTVKVKRGVVIQVDVKPEVKPEAKPAG